MFTGIVEQIGIVVSVIRTQQIAKLAVSAGKYFDDIKAGDSISVNGVCLTVTQARRGMAEFDVTAETLKRSVLGELKISDKANLEKALLVSGRLGGHLVTGHVDGVGELKEKVVNGETIDLYLSIPSEILRYLVPKGSLAVNGVSLTVADFRDGLLKISAIPLTLKTTTLGGLNVGDRVNIEVDLISKYIEKHLRGDQPRGINEEMMVKMGFLPMGWIDN